MNPLSNRLLYYLTACLVLFSMGTCEPKEDPPHDPEPDVGLYGIWSRDDIEVSFVGNHGSFFAIYFGNWLTVFNDDSVMIGDYKFRNLTRTSDSTWTGEELWYWVIDGSTPQIKWSKDCWLTRNKANSKLKSVGFDPWDGHTEEHYYYRITN